MDSGVSRRGSSGEVQGDEVRGNCSRELCGAAIIGGVSQNPISEKHYLLKLITCGSELDQLNAETVFAKNSDILSYEISAFYSKSKHWVGKRVKKHFKHRKTLMGKRRKKLDSSICDDRKCG